ncbi:Surface layer protein HAP50 [Lactobacillus helsingborgensis]|uniref:SLAP domain-containing protein n=1 Tax=Lactobacillus helsingborgensis TaxID=1218494 RepID=V5T7A2_9LACO|nr:SLAP domain-containing protein [Lactobacillus helsingborgensis]AHB59765.1 surface layer protein [Lactobacillus helsingborgensis]KJY62985.1 Surface layer protein HAP50 [Lactobacillus helsingborgensis]UZX29458.1 SLAP domain-containing protein [Lactobacillus helsingborgensis]
MKKNLRIVSAAAAALLAVAPVAATGVSTVFAADTPVSVDGSTTTNTANVAKLTLNVTNAASLVGNDSPSKVAASISTTTLPTGATVVPAKAQIFAVKADDTVATTPTTDKLVGGQKYVAKVVVSITGLTSLAGKTNGLTVNDKAYDVNGSGIATGIELTSSPFTVPDSTLKGAPYVTYKDNGKDVIADTGSVDLDSNSYSVKGVADKIDASRTSNGTNGKYTASVSVKGDGAATASFLNLEQDVKDALTAAGVTVKADGSFDKPAAPFTVTTHVFATNGKTATFTVRVNPSATVGDPTFPKITYNSQKYFGTQTIDSIGDAKFNYVPVNGVVDTKAIQDAFTTTVSDTDPTVMIPTVDASKVNTKVAGKYPVTVSATNAEGKTTKVTFMLTVGVKGAEYKTVQSDGDIPVYKIDGNVVTDSKTTVKNGDTIAVFGDPIKVGEKSYTRINSADSDLYVESKYVDGSFKPADKVKKTVMHNSYIYDKDHKRVGTDMLRAYSTVEVIGAATKLADGSLVYQIGDNQFVMADNIDGTSRTLTHNAYVYKTSKKRADGRVLKAGTKVTTYGSPYTFKNGKAYYRIGGPKKQYVKVANF